MNKAALWLGAAGVVAGMAMPRHASAAEMFADVPTDHWAYQAVNNLQERGIVIGYPDGTFGGKRAMTRYEFAVAVDRLVDWVNKSIAAIPPAPTPPAETPGVTEDRVRELIDERVKDLPTKEDLETVRRLVDEFKDELTALGTNVESLRRDLDSLKARVGAIEEKLNRIHFSGDASFIARGERGQRANLGGPGSPSTRNAPIDLNDRIDNNGTSDILQNVKTLYNLDLGITYKVNSGATANALLNFGNYLPWVNSNRINPGVDSRVGGVNGGYAKDVSTVPAVPTGQGIAGPVVTNPNLGLANSAITQGNFGKEATDTSLAEFTPVKMYLESPVRNLWFLKDIDATVGKFGIQFTPYTLKQVDPDSYSDVSLTDSGEIVANGAMAKASIAGVHLTGYAATHYNGRSYSSGYPVFISWGGPAVLSAMNYGAMPIDQSMGVHGTYQLGRFALGGTYITAGLTPLTGVPFTTALYENRPNDNNGDRQMVPVRGEVYGGQLSFPIVSRLAFTGEFASSNILAGTRVGDREGVYPSELRNAYDGKLTWGVGRLSLAAGYKQVDPFFGAPGAWGNIGRWQNPTNIKGWNASGGYNFGGFTLKGSWEDYKSVRIDASDGTSAIPLLVTRGPAGSGFDGRRNTIQHYTAGLSYNLGPSNTIDLGYEDARIRPWNVLPSVLGNGKTNESYVDIGLGHRFNDNTGIKVLYQIVDYKDHGAGLYTVPGGEYKGGIGVTQVSVKF